ncbi:MAG: hypothetical protein Q4D82_01645 [Neisseria sp.]|nr:hypothetical protein [Neisseria sp.]
MLAQIELTPARAEALAQLEKATGESRSALLIRALDSFIEQQREYEELRASVERGRADIAAGRCYSHEEAMARIRSRINESAGKK